MEITGIMFIFHYFSFRDYGIVYLQKQVEMDISFDFFMTIKEI